jgi:hypothetical protein
VAAAGGVWVFAEKAQSYEMLRDELLLKWRPEESHVPIWVGEFGDETGLGTSFDNVHNPRAGSTAGAATELAAKEGFLAHAVRFLHEHDLGWAY